LERIFIAGGAGFIGSHFVQRLLSMPGVKGVTAYDNLSSGKRSHLDPFSSDKRLRLIEGGIEDTGLLMASMKEHDTVIHLASNPDIARAVVEPSIDFTQGTFLTNQVVEAARSNKVLTILYASGSGVYGELGHKELAEDYGPLMPISTYGASKLAGEALICAYAYMFDMKGLVFRFGNVVGARQTHGVAYDFLRKLRANPKSLEVLGDGTQSKSYVHVDDVIDAVLLAYNRVDKPFDVFNVATSDYITVKEIAEIVINKAAGNPSQVQIKFTGGDRGWKGDVPIIRLDTEKIRKLGWKCGRSSREAISASVDSMISHG
jgi:UDP-glucose 4-epimerase